MQNYDVVVIGAGSMGMAAGYFLAKNGKKTLLLDSFNPPHDHGSHHGETRIIRYAYGEGEQYVPFALRARDLWQDLAQKTNKELFLQTGVINVGDRDDRFIQNVITSAGKFDLPLEVLSSGDIHKKWEGIYLPENFIGCYEPTSGILKVELCMEAYRELAVKEGAEIRTNSKVIQIDTQSDHQLIITTENGESFTSNSAVLSVGAWAGELLKQLDLNLPLTPIRKTFAWYDVDEGLYSRSKFPAFAFKLSDSIFYGFPSIDGAGLKVGRHDGGEMINPDEDKLPFGEVLGDEEDLTSFLDRFMPHEHTLKFGKTCMYTMTPDEDFIIDTHPNFKNIAIAAGFSGHGFKFASAVGEALSNLIIKGKTDLDITPFAINRFNRESK